MQYAVLVRLQNFFHFLRDLLGGLEANVDSGVGCRSRLFKIRRGVRQGDPLSPILFIAVLSYTFDSLNKMWSKENKGLHVGAANAKSLFTHLLFADDITMLARSRKGLSKQLEQLVEGLQIIGLKLNASKCVIQTNSYRQGCKPLCVKNMEIPVVAPCDGFKVLGVQWCLIGGTSLEFQRRIASAWRRFFALRQLLCNRNGDLHKRMRMLTTSCGSVALWGNKSWTLTLAEKKKLRSTHRHMLRLVLGARRRPTETFVDWIKRTTRQALIIADKTGVRCWLEIHLLNKWAWAGHVARMPTDRWAKRITEWRLELMGVAPHNRIRRARAGARIRWESDLQKYCDWKGFGRWELAAQDKIQWSEAARDFACYRTP